MQKILSALLWVICFQMVSGVIGYFTQANMGWYNTLDKAALNPPDLTFPIVWTLLYVLLALAGWMTWRDFRRKGVNKAFVLFWIQMVMNWAWSFVFFEFHMIALGFYWICVLNIMMIAYILVQWKSNKIAAGLVCPTVLWGGFAAYLNYSIMVLN